MLPPSHFRSQNRNNEQNQEDQEDQEDQENQELRNEERVTGREEEYSSTNDNGSIGTLDIDNDEDNNNNNDNDNANNNVGTNRARNNTLTEEKRACKPFQY